MNDYEHHAAMSRSYAIQYAADLAALKEEGNDMDQNDYSNLDRLDGQPHDNEYYFAPRSARIASLVKQSMEREPEPRLTGHEIGAIVATVAACVFIVAYVLVGAW